MSRPYRLALTPDQIKEARGLKATRSWPLLAKRYKVTVNQVRYALDADRQRIREQERKLQRERTRDHKAERGRVKAKAKALGFRSAYEMKMVRAAERSRELGSEPPKRCAWCGGQVKPGPAGPGQKPGPAWGPQPVPLPQNP